MLDIGPIKARCEAHLALMKNAARPISSKHWTSMGEFERACREDLPDCTAEIERLTTALRDLYNDCRNEPADKQRGIVMDQAFEALEQE